MRSGKREEVVREVYVCLCLSFSLLLSLPLSLPLSLTLSLTLCLSLCLLPSVFLILSQSRLLSKVAATGSWTTSTRPFKMQSAKQGKRWISFFAVATSKRSGTWLICPPWPVQTSTRASARSTSTTQARRCAPFLAPVFSCVSE